MKGRKELIESQMFMFLFLSYSKSVNLGFIAPPIYWHIFEIFEVLNVNFVIHTNLIEYFMFLFQFVSHHAAP